MCIMYELFLKCGLNNISSCMPFHIALINFAFEWVLIPGTTIFPFFTVLLYLTIL